MRITFRKGSYSFPLTIISVVMASIATIPAIGADWTELFPTSSPIARYGHTMTTVGTDVYIFGGQSIPGVEHNDLWRWDRSQQTWVELTPSTLPPAVRFQHGAASVIGRLYIGFGLNIGGPLGDVWEYNPANNEWNEVVIPGPGVRQHGGLAALGDDRLFVAGGYADLAGANPILDAWILDPGSQTGVQIANLSEGRIGFSAGAMGDRPMIIGGWLPGSAVFSNEILIWNPLPGPLGTWEIIVPTGVTPLARASAATVQLLKEPDKSSGWGDDILILGGEGGTGSKAATVPTSSSTQMYGTVSNVWSFGEDMPMALAGSAAAILPPLSGPDSSQLEVLMFGGHEFQVTTLVATDRTFLYLSEIVVPLNMIFSDGFESGDTLAW